MTKETKNPDIMLPEAACELCGFTGEERLQLHAAEDTLIILKEKMTAMELVHAIDALGEIASNLTVHLAKACGFCDNCGDEDPGLCEDCAAKASAEQRKNAGAVRGMGKGLRPLLGAAGGWPGYPAAGASSGGSRYPKGLQTGGLR
jgi:hypothetical protein